MDFSTANEQTEHGKSRACPQCVEKCQRIHCSQTAPAGALGHFTPAPNHPCFLRTALEHNLRSNMVCWLQISMLFSNSCLTLILSKSETPDTDDEISLVVE